jgi:Domain of unknown function (DUF4129)
VRIDPRGALNAGLRMRSGRAVFGSVLLAVLVVVVAGTTGTAHFAGARWMPDFNTGQAKPAPQKVQGPPATRLRPISRHVTGGFPLGTAVLWIIVAIAVAGIVRMLWRWWADRRSRPAFTRNSVVVGATSEIPIEPEPEPEPDTPALRTGIELALQALDERRDPADAVVRAWLGLQETAEESGIVRLPAETPTEFTSRILSRAFADDLPVRTLLRLYLRTRFGDHPATADDVAAARVALQELVRTWPAPASLTGTGSR